MTVNLYNMSHSLNEMVIFVKKNYLFYEMETDFLHYKYEKCH